MTAVEAARRFTYFRTLQKNLRLYEAIYGDVCGLAALRRHVVEEMRKLAKLMRYGAASVLLMVIATAALAQHSHPAADVPIHEKFYGTWMMPDEPTKSCCNKADCYPTEVRRHNGHWQARRREDGKWLWIPDAKVERHRDNPDGRNHLCAPPPGASYPPDTVFCFALGGGI